MQIIFSKTIFERHNKVRWKPNEKFAYSNLGYVLLGELIETISGESYEDYITHHIIDRLSLQPADLGFTISDNLATGYQNKKKLIYLLLGFMMDKNKFMDEDEGRWKPFKNFYVNGTAYGGLIGTKNAFTKYLRELMKPHTGLISPPFKELLFKENYLNNGKASGMCLSWFTGNLNGKKYFAHAGGGGGYYCEIRLYPEIATGSVIMFNRTGISDETFLSKVDRYFLLQNQRQ